MEMCPATGTPNLPSPPKQQPALRPRSVHTSEMSSPYRPDVEWDWKGPVGWLRPVARQLQDPVPRSGWKRSTDSVCASSQGPYQRLPGEDGGSERGSGSPPTPPGHGHAFPDLSRVLNPDVPEA